MDATTRLKGAARLSEISVNKLSGFFSIDYVPRERDHHGHFTR